MSLKVEYKNNKSEDILTRTFSGSIAMHDIISSWIYIINNKILSNSHKGVISDYREAALDLKIEDIQELENFFNKNLEIFQNLKMAQVANSPQIVFPMIFEQEHTKFKTKPFSTIKAAEYWASSVNEI